MGIPFEAKGKGLNGERILYRRQVNQKQQTSRLNLHFGASNVALIHTLVPFSLQNGQCCSFC
jgi:hypothetical protein